MLTLSIGQNITFLPYCDEGQIVALYNNDDQKIAYAKPGENVKVSMRDEVLLFNQLATRFILRVSRKTM